VAPDDLGGAEDPGGLAASQPDLAISAPADTTQQVIVGNERQEVPADPGSGRRERLEW